MENTIDQSKQNEIESVDLKDNQSIKDEKSDGKMKN